MDNDDHQADLSVQYSFTHETKNCYAYEPEEGADAMGKLYLRKSAVGLPEAPKTITVAITFDD